MEMVETAEMAAALNKQQTTIPADVGTGNYLMYIIGRGLCLNCRSTYRSTQKRVSNHNLLWSALQRKNASRDNWRAFFTKP
jgi:hypothetical protein